MPLFDQVTRPRPMATGFESGAPPFAAFQASTSTLGSTTLVYQASESAPCRIVHRSEIIQVRELRSAVPGVLRPDEPRAADARPILDVQHLPAVARPIDRIRLAVSEAITPAVAAIENGRRRIACWMKRRVSGTVQIIDQRRVVRGELSVSLADEPSLRIDDGPRHRASGAAAAPVPVPPVPPVPAFVPPVPEPAPAPPARRAAPGPLRIATRLAAAAERNDDGDASRGSAQSASARGDGPSKKRYTGSTGACCSFQNVKRFPTARLWLSAT